MSNKPECWGHECHRWRPGNLCSHPDAGKIAERATVRTKSWLSCVVDDVWDFLTGMSERGP